MKRLPTLLATLAVVMLSYGQHIPLDYSHCGYRQSEVEIPLASNVVYVACDGGDASTRIQQAIDYASGLKPDRHSGLRGAVLLGEGVYELDRPLRLHTSGVVLRGSGRQQTILRKHGTDRGAVVYIEGQADCTVADTLDLRDETVVAGDSILHTIGDSPLSKGDEVVVWRPSTSEWIRQLRCEVFGGGQKLGYWGWHPGDIDIRWVRTVRRAEGSTLVLDAPITTTLDPQYGGGKVLVCRWSGRVADCGVENLRIESDYRRDLPHDEDHAWDGVSIANARDCWVRMVDFRHLAGSAVVVTASGNRITVEDCKSTAPISEIGGMRRRTFYTLGGQCLFQRCYSEHGLHDFCAGIAAPGPNAFVQCESHESLGYSGSIGAWASGLLFDCVDIDQSDLKLRNLELDNYGAGWNSGNSLLWQCTASGIHCYRPEDGSTNSAHGCWGQMWGDGEWSQPNEHVKPWSIFQDQLERRLGHKADRQCRILNRLANDATSSPTIEQAIALSAEAKNPKTTMQMWIDSAQFAGSILPNGVPSIGKCLKKKGTHITAGAIPQQTRKFAIAGGRLTVDGCVMTGKKHDSPWWNGRLRPTAIPKATYALTRFVPGAEGRGLTDRVDSVVAEMERTHTTLYAQNYGLWYDRRRDDHERIRRADGNVWGPFYEQPFARSGQGTAWDGLSRYDLLRGNAWYYDRLREYADKGSSHGMALLLEHYFQHNILEAGAHWVDCPWRTANNVNNTPFAEPPHFSGDKRIFIAEQFYDISNDTLRQLHRQYIRRNLETFANSPNVVHSVGAEYTGPYDFVKFWLTCIAEWEGETGHDVMVALKTTKDVQDSILCDPMLSPTVDIIAIEQWYDTDKGLYAPPGGVSMAPRQYLRKVKTGTPRFEQVYHSVSTYRQSYPEKAVAYFGKSHPELAWASFMAGGSCAAVPVTDTGFLKAAAGMTPTQADGQYLLTSPSGVIVYSDNGGKVTLPAGHYKQYSVDAKSGAIGKGSRVSGGTLQLPGRGIYWYALTE